MGGCQRYLYSSVINGRTLARIWCCSDASYTPLVVKEGTVTATFTYCSKICGRFLVDSRCCISMCRSPRCCDTADYRCLAFDTRRHRCSCAGHRPASGLQDRCTAAACPWPRTCADIPRCRPDRGRPPRSADCPDPGGIWEGKVAFRGLGQGNWGKDSAFN